MSLNDLLRDNGICNVLIVDDVYDSVPTANDIGQNNENWPTFNDDLKADQRKLISDDYPKASEVRFDELINDDRYIETIWNLRNTLGKICDSLFSEYIRDQELELQQINIAAEKLESLGLECEKSGRDFVLSAQSADLILIDLFLNKNQDEKAIEESKQKLLQAIKSRIENPPLVILMSRSHRLESKREEFRDEVGLLDSAFRIIRKSDLEDANYLERQIERLAKNSSDSKKLAAFFCNVERGMQSATERTLSLLRRLKLSDIGQIQQLLLSAEGQPTGSYIVDVFDRVLQHEIERDSGIIDAAIELNGITSLNHPPPYVAGSPELQDLVERLLTQNDQRLRLPGSVEAAVTFGDILKITGDANIDRLKTILLVDLSPDKVLLVLTPACDLQRRGVPRILLLVGALKPLSVQDWSYGEDARTSVIRINNELCWIKWNLKHIDTVSIEQLDNVLNNDLQVVARLREAHVLELQQRVLSGLGRVGMIATLPATFPVNIEAYYVNREGVPTRMDVPALADGAVCFVGRDDNGATALRLITTDYCCDHLIDAYIGLDVNQIHERARTAFNHVCSTDDFRQILTTGIELKGVNDRGWSHISSLTGVTANIPKMGLLAWNYQNSATTLSNKDLTKAGVVILIRDLDEANSPGLQVAVQNGLIQSGDEDDVNFE